MPSILNDPVQGDPHAFDLERHGFVLELNVSGVDQPEKLFDFRLRGVNFFLNAEFLLKEIHHRLHGDVKIASRELVVV